LSFLAAIRFLTSIPVPWFQEHWQHRLSREQFARSLPYYPVVGLIIGLILAGLSWLLALFLPHFLVSGLLLAALVGLSGGLHLDGFIDTVDGLAAGHSDTERRKKIMHQGGAGAIGVVAVVVLLLVKFVALNDIPQASLIATLVLVPVVGRWAMVYAVFFYPYGNAQGMGKELKEGVGWWGFVAATIVTLAVVIALAQVAGLVILAVVWLMTVAAAAFLKGKMGGLTGDTYGGINEVAEVLVLIMVVLISFNGWF
jgi:adenosylcobinamide-GDP ribazoletransferase